MAMYTLNIFSRKLRKTNTFNCETLNVLSSTFVITGCVSSVVSNSVLMGVYIYKRCERTHYLELKEKICISINILAIHMMLGNISRKGLYRFVYSIFNII